MDAITRISKDVAAELTEHLSWGDDLRRTGLYRQAACYDLFLEGKMPYGIMLRHFERQRTAAFRNHAGFLDKLKKLPGKLKKVVQDQAGKWKARLDKAVQESLPELAKLKAIEDEEGIKTKKSLWQKVLEKFATNVMDDYEESLAAIKDDPKAIQEFVNKLFEGAMTKAKQGLAKTLPAFLVAGLFGGPAAIGAMFFRKALFRAAKAAIKAGDAILTRTLGEGYTEKKEQVKEFAKDKTRNIVMGVIRKVFKSQKDAGEKIGAGVGAMALILKAGKETKDALQAAHGYIEKKYGKTTADALGNILKALAIAGVMRAGASAIGVVAEWFAEDPEMADLAGALKAGGQDAMGDEELNALIGHGAEADVGDWGSDEWDWELSEGKWSDEQAKQIGETLGMSPEKLDDLLNNGRESDIMRELAKHRGDSDAVDGLLDDLGAPTVAQFGDVGQLNRALGSTVVQLDDGRMAMHLGGDNFVAIDDDKLGKIEDWYNEAMERAQNSKSPFKHRKIKQVRDLLKMNMFKLGDKLDTNELPEGLAGTWKNVQDMRESMGGGQGSSGRVTPDDDL